MVAVEALQCLAMYWPKPCTNHSKVGFEKGVYLCVCACACVCVFCVHWDRGALPNEYLRR